LLNVIQKEKKK
jgi:hypothetical protein